MKLTQKLFFFFFATLITTGICVYFLSSQIFLRGFSQIEDDMALRNLHRVSDLLTEEAENLGASAVSWSSWNDTYEYVVKKNTKFEKDNWESNAVFESKYSQVVIFDQKGNVIYSKGYDWENKTFNEIELSQLNLLKEEVQILIQDGSGQQKNGYFVGSGNKAYAISISPILNSLGLGPLRGWIVISKEINDSMKKKYSTLLKLDMDLSVGSSEEWSDKVTSEGYLLRGASSIQGLIAKSDISGRKKIIARLYIPRTIYSQGRKTVFSFTMVIGFFLTVSYGLVFFGFHRDVLKKIMVLKNSLNEIGRSNSGRMGRVQWKGKDEIAELSQNINSMLERLENSQVMVNRASKFSALGEMAGSIAHEINNPLAIITGFCTRLIRAADRAEVDTKEIKDTANRILNTANRIDRIIKSLRLVSRDGERDTKDEVALGDIIEEVISLCENKLEGTGIELRLENFDRNQKVSVRFVQLVQVLLNLFTNSIDAISNRQEKWIEVRTEFDGQFVSIFVVDSGEGISSEIAEKIMNPFFTTKEIGKGTGLGLSISKGIIESHNGQFVLVKEAQHTTFRITLPR